MATGRSRERPTKRRSARTEATGDLQGLVPTLAGLARVLIADDPEEARRVAEEALALGPAMAHVSALLASGWVALAQGDRRLADERATEAAAAARTRRDRAALAETLELRVLASDEPAHEVDRLVEAASIWRDLENPLGEARVELIAALVTADEPRARAAEERLRALSARGYPHDAVAHPPARPGRPRRDPVARPVPGAAGRRAGAPRRLAVAEGA